MHYDSSKAPTETPVRLIYESRPFYRRPKFLPTLIAVIGVCAIESLLIVSCMQRIHINGSVALLLALSAALIGGFLVNFVRKWVVGLCKLYRIAMTERGTIFTVNDRFHGKRHQVFMPYAQIEYVNNFTYGAHPALVFHLARHRVVEVPIGILANDPGPILQILLEKQVRLVHIE